MSKKISFILVAILCISFIFSNQIYLSVQANDYIIYNLKNPPPVTGSLLSSHKVTSETQFWRHSGGEWSYTSIVGGHQLKHFQLVKWIKLYKIKLLNRIL